MSITDELRGWTARRLAGWKMTREEHDELSAIADRIDAEYEKAIHELNGFAEDSVLLPKDADGEVIHVGDAVTCGATVWTVTGLKFLGEGWGICCTVYNEYGGSGTNVYPPSDLRHHHELTVEDMLREFAEKITDSQIPGVHPTYEEAIAEYAKRLTLAEGEDE